jgi:hypothetical protein
MPRKLKFTGQKAWLSDFLIVRDGMEDHLRRNVLVHAPMVRRRWNQVFEWLCFRLEKNKPCQVLREVAASHRASVDVTVLT